MKILSILFFVFTFTLSSCSEYTPKPIGYARIEKVAADTVRLQASGFSFLYSSLAKIEYLNPEVKNEVWFNIYYPTYKAKIYCTYIPTNNKELSKMLDDSHQLAYSHAVRAESISQTLFSDSPKHLSGLIYDIKGSVASPVQFYVTNNSSKFMRGALYFDDAVKSDSIAPVVAFLRDDIVRIMESLQW